MWLVDGPAGNLQAVIDRQQKQSKRVGVMAGTDTAAELKADKMVSLGTDLPDIARNIYDALRMFKNEDIDVILCETFPETSIGQAIMNRLQKQPPDI